MEAVKGVSTFEEYTDKSDFQWNLIRGMTGPFVARGDCSYPYNSPDFEFPTPLKEMRRQQLVDSFLSLDEQYKIGSELWCMSKSLGEITQEAANHRALLRVYAGPDKQKEPEITRENGTMWAHYNLSLLLNATGARNRLRVVKQEFRKSADDFEGRVGSEFNVLSVAAGSSIGLMTAIDDLGRDGVNNIRLTMVDQSEKAETDAAEQALKLGINNDCVKFIKANVFRFNRYLQADKHFNFIEVVGLLDYLTDPQVVKLLGKLRESLAVGGVLLFSNIAPNTERYFVEKIVGWPEMIYRKADELLVLGKDAGFESDNSMNLITEPSGIYNLVTAVK